VQNDPLRSCQSQASAEATGMRTAQQIQFPIAGTARVVAAASSTASAKQSALALLPPPLLLHILLFVDAESHIRLLFKAAESKAGRRHPPPPTFLCRALRAAARSPLSWRKHVDVSALLNPRTGSITCVTAKREFLLPALFALSGVRPLMDKLPSSLAFYDRIMLAALRWLAPYVTGLSFRPEDFREAFDHIRGTAFPNLRTLAHALISGDNGRFPRLSCIVQDCVLMPSDIELMKEVHQPAPTACIISAVACSFLCVQLPSLTDLSVSSFCAPFGEIAAALQTLLPQVNNLRGSCCCCC
jgi:hypothetical protein